MSNPWIDTLFRECQRIEDQANALRRLSRTFDVVGNQALAGELDMLAAELLASRKALRDGFSDYQTAQLRGARRDQADVFRALINRLEAADADR